MRLQHTYRSGTLAELLWEYWQRNPEEELTVQDAHLKAAGRRHHVTLRAVRDALAQLTTDGWVERLAGRGSAYRARLPLASAPQGRHQ
jgi:Fe2+ or Zn2+ uptake regulation protein